jgi:hypothetical protein
MVIIIIIVIIVIRTTMTTTTTTTTTLRVITMITCFPADDELGTCRTSLGGRQLGYK